MRRFLSILLILCLMFTCLPVFAEEADEEEEMYRGYSNTGYKVIQRGDRDADEATAVLLLQQGLIKAGYLDDSADGVYGANTEIAVAAFQRNNGLTETGIADAATQDKLFNDPDIVVAEKSMDKGSVTSRTQKKLALWGFYTGSVDGKGGENTNAAVKAFRSYLKGYYLVNPTPSPEPTATPKPKATPVTLGFDDGMIADDELLVPEEEETKKTTVSTEIDEEILAFVDGKYEFEVYRQDVIDGATGDEVTRVQKRLHTLNYLAKIDGVMNQRTERALLYFQKTNGLPLTGIADEETQRRLFSDEAIRSAEYINAYKIIVNKTDQRVYIYQWNGTDYSMPVHAFVCSTGMRGAETETPSGTFSAVGPSGYGEWYYFKKYECYAKWGYYIVGGIMFHSVIYSKGKSLNKESVRKLGRRASHGCIRLEVEAARWIYENCPAGTTIVITD